MRDATSAKPIVSMYVKVKETTSGRDKLIVQSLYEKSIRLTKLNLVASKDILKIVVFTCKEFQSKRSMNEKIRRKFYWML